VWEAGGGWTQQVVKEVWGVASVYLPATQQTAPWSRIDLRRSPSSSLGIAIPSGLSPGLK